MAAMDPVSQLRLKVLPILQSWEQRLRAEHPDIVVTIYDESVGTLTDWKGHDVGIECFFKDTDPERPDHVTLAISLKHLHWTPMIDSAGVVWGHPSGCVEASLLPEAVGFSEDRLDEIVKQLPVLFTGLQQAVARGRPSDD